MWVKSCRNMGTFLAPMNDLACESLTYDDWLAMQSTIHIEIFREVHRFWYAFFEYATSNRFLYGTLSHKTHTFQTLADVCYCAYYAVYREVYGRHHCLNINTKTI